jgi:putative phage-type endonuclease
MKILNVEQNTDAWLEARRGKITGSKLGDIVVKRGTGKKIGFYELIAERLSVQEEPEDPMERGHRLEDEARKKFEETTGKTVSTAIGMCYANDNDDITLSPDGLIDNDGKWSEAVEIKCLSGAKHLKAYFEKEVPDEYEFQVLQYFIVNEDLETLYFCFYDPRITALPFHYIAIKRDSVAEDVEEYREYQKTTLAEINDLITQLAF